MTRLIFCLILLLLAPLGRAEPERLQYAYQAYDAHGLWVASGRLTLMLFDDPHDHQWNVIASREQQDVYNRQHDFRLGTDIMQGTITQDTIELGPSLFSEPAEIRLYGQFIHSPLGHFDGYWERKRIIQRGAGFGTFQAWPIGETAERYGRRREE